MSLVVGVVCYPSFGGSGVVAAELAAELARRGHRVHLFAGAAPGRGLPPAERLTLHEVKPAPYPIFEHPPYTVALASAIVEVGRRERLDVLHSHYAVPHAASALLAAQVLGAAAPALVTSLHGTDVTHTGVEPSYAPITRFALERSDAVVVPSRYLADEARRRLGVSGAQVISNFVDVERFAPPAARRPALLDALFEGRGGPTLFHVSNFRPVKRPGDLVEVLERVRRTVPARLVLVGDGPERARIMAEVSARGLEPHVRFLGRRAEFAAELACADAFLLPSETESFGLAALEALSAGVPVLGYAVGGLPEVVTPEVGRLVPAFDVGALADATAGLLGDAGELARLSRAARARVLEAFRPEAAVMAYEALYRRLARRSS